MSLLGFEYVICALQNRFQSPILDALMENTTQESKIQEPKFHAVGPRTNSWCTNGGSHSRVYNSRIGNPIPGEQRIKDASTNNSNGSRIKWGFEDPRTFRGPKNQWDLED